MRTDTPRSRASFSSCIRSPWASWSRSISCLLAFDAPQCQVPVAGGCGELGASAAAHEFFERYAAALLARDEKAMAQMYAVPSLVLFPGQSIAVSDASQTEEFFAASWNQYEGVDAVDNQIVVMGEAPGSLWVDVTWSYGGQARERFCYQLVAAADGYRIAVLTPMA
ncbi:MAG: hypothetical protein ACR2FF_02065 [Mycobacteriales bacterium]